MTQAPLEWCRDGNSTWGPSSFGRRSCSHEFNAPVSILSHLMFCFVIRYYCRTSLISPFLVITSYRNDSWHLGVISRQPESAQHIIAVMRENQVSLSEMLVWKAFFHRANGGGNDIKCESVVGRTSVAMVHRLALRVNLPCPVLSCPVHQAGFLACLMMTPFGEG